jgi:hypothetical protein
MKLVCTYIMPPECILANQFPASFEVSILGRRSLVISGYAKLCFTDPLT